MIYIIVNEKSKTGKGFVCWNEGQIDIIVIGGDGTLNEVINGITDFQRVRMALIPTGSGNDFARGMGIGKDISTNIDMIFAGNNNKMIDIGKVSWEGGNQRLFAISAGVGMDALVCKKTNDSKLKKLLNIFHMGQLTYILLTIQSLFTMTTAGEIIRYYSFDDNGDEVKSEDEYDRLIFTAAMNQRAEGGGVPMAPVAKPDDGKHCV